MQDLLVVLGIAVAIIFGGLAGFFIDGPDD